MLARFAASRCPRPEVTSSAAARRYAFLRSNGSGRRQRGRRVQARREAQGADIFLDEPSVTGTENALMAAVRASAPPCCAMRVGRAVQDLAGFRFARRRIDGIGSNTSRSGRPASGRPPVHRRADHIEIGSFIVSRRHGGAIRSTVSAATTAIHLAAFERLASGGLDGARRSSMPTERRIRPIWRHVQARRRPWPPFRRTSCHRHRRRDAMEGCCSYCEKLFESRLFFVDKLIGMGARIVLCDPHRAVIAGHRALRGQQVESGHPGRVWRCLLAALAAQAIR